MSPIRTKLHQFLLSRFFTFLCGQTERQTDRQTQTRGQKETIDRSA